MKYTNKSNLEKITLENYQGHFSRMEVYLTDAECVVVVNDDGTVKEYDEDEEEPIIADANKVFADFGDRCVSVSVIHIERADDFQEDRWVRYIDEIQLTNIKNHGQNQFQ